MLRIFANILISFKWHSNTLECLLLWIKWFQKCIFSPDFSSPLWLILFLSSNFYKKKLWKIKVLSFNFELNFFVYLCSKNLCDSIDSRKVLSLSRRTDIVISQTAPVQVLFNLFRRYRWCYHQRRHRHHVFHHQHCIIIIRNIQRRLQ